ncbi:AraC family transcriptional regulator [bacterium]|nr:AraC family transcriptional regulator [bacterium]MCI0606537.1 AraC family transcriptional regulator [bacterium]
MALRLSCGRFFGKLQRTVQLQHGRLSEAFYSKGERQPAHSHELPHICLTVNGTYRESIARKMWTIPNGVMTFYHPEQIHRDEHLTDGIHFVIEIDAKKGSFVETLLPQFVRDPVSFGRNLSTAWRLYEEFSCPDTFSMLAMEALTLELLVESFRTEFSGNEKRRPLWMNSVLAILKLHFSSPPSLSEIAEEIGVHPVHLAKTFRRFEGHTPGEFIRKLRVDFARQKLSGTSEPLSQIALDAGFADQTHFTKVFKRLTGLTPRRFRILSQH